MGKTRFFCEASIIAALYAVFTIALAPLGYGLIQIRVAEAFTILPVFTPAAIPGLFVGCIVANIYGGAGPVDIIFGSIATLLAALATYKMPKRYLVPLPPILFNALIVGFILNYVYQYNLIISILSVAAGETVACYGLGYPLMVQLEKYSSRIFKRNYVR